MWRTGAFGIATTYAESVIAVKSRAKTESGTMLAGAMYALERGLTMKWLAVLLAAFGIGNGVQANAVASLINETFPYRWQTAAEKGGEPGERGSPSANPS